MFNHYFIDKEHNKNDYFSFNFVFNEKNFKFKSVDNVFSKDEIDYGSLLLINTVIKNFNLSNKDCLDLGCGYGTIGILLKSKFENANFLMTDITKSAVDLSNYNLKENNIKAETRISNLFENIGESFDFIISNPPIKTGKALLFRFIEESFSHLKNQGKICVVIKKNLGMESLKKKMQEVYNNCEILKRDKGFYILCSTKEEL